MFDYKDYIYAVYRHRSFSKAAQALHVSQPWLSSAVKKAEQELSLPLFDRSTNPVSLTEAGKYYIEQIEKIDALEQEMKEYFASLRAQDAVSLNIGSSMFFCTYVLPSLLNDFRAQYPQASITLTEGHKPSLIEKLHHGELDLMMEVEEIKEKGIRTLPWATEEIVLAVPADSPVNKGLKKYQYSFGAFLKRHKKGGMKPPVPLAKFANEPFLLLSEENDVHARSVKLCENAGFTPEVKLLLTQMMTAYYLVCEGQGVSFLRSTIPEYVAPNDRIVFYQLEDPLASRNIYLSYPEKKASAMQQKLIEYLEKKTPGK